jgi:hypothetical protein
MVVIVRDIVLLLANGTLISMILWQVHALGKKSLEEILENKWDLTLFLFSSVLPLFLVLMLPLQTGSSFPETTQLIRKRAVRLAFRAAVVSITRKYR